MDLEHPKDLAWEVFGKGRMECAWSFLSGHTSIFLPLTIQVPGPPLLPVASPSRRRHGFVFEHEESPN